MQAHGAVLRLRSKDPVFVDHLLSNYRLADLEPQDRAMLDFAVKLTQAPDRCSEVDLDKLREVGFGDEDILHIVELTAISTTTGGSPTRPACFPTPIPPARSRPR